MNLLNYELVCKQEVDYRWELDRQSVLLDSCSLGEGEFGRVVKATLVSPDSATATTVAVKMLKGDISSLRLNSIIIIMMIHLVYFTHKKYDKNCK